jgi:shikimate kinase
MNSPHIKTNVILIGMPGAGKSTLGVQLAKCLGLDFVDTDLLIQSQQGEQLQSILDTKGYQALRDIEEQVLLSIRFSNTLIATGGSAVYSTKAMQQLKSLGVVVFLEVGLTALQSRVNGEGNNEASRGIARPEGQSFADVFAERSPLYQRYADVTYNNEHTTNINDLVEMITPLIHK